MEHRPGKEHWKAKVTFMMTMYREKKGVIQLIVYLHITNLISACIDKWTKATFLFACNLSLTECVSVREKVPVVSCLFILVSLRLCCTEE